MHQSNNSILVTDYLSKMGIKTVPHPPYSPDLAPCDFCLFPKLRGGRYETIEEMKEAVTKVIDTLPQEDIHGSFQKLLKRNNKCIAAEGDYFEGEKSFMCALSINVPIRKSLETYLMILVCTNSNLFNLINLKPTQKLQYNWSDSFCLLMMFWLLMETPWQYYSKNKGSVRFENQSKENCN